MNAKPAAKPAAKPTAKPAAKSSLPASSAQAAWRRWLPGWSPGWPQLWPLLVMGGIFALLALFNWLVWSGAGAPRALEVRITPPDYTGQAPIFLHAGPAPIFLDAGKPAQTGATQGGATQTDAAAFDVPAGSLISARIYGGNGGQQLRLGAQTIPFESFAPGDYRVAIHLTAGKAGKESARGGAYVLSVIRGARVLAAWELNILADAPPRIAFVSPPASDERLALHIDFEAADDYGLENVWAVISRVRSVTVDAKGKLDFGGNDLGLPGEGVRQVKGFEIELKLPADRPRRARAGQDHDLTAHPWAGQPVLVQLKAADSAGQTSFTPAVLAVLPARAFRHPVARAIIDQRHQLSPAGGRTMTVPRQYVARALERLGDDPAAFGNDTVVFLGLQSAHRRLLGDSSPTATAEIRNLLWDLARRLEGDGVFLAEGTSGD